MRPIEHDDIRELFYQKQRKRHNRMAFAEAAGILVTLWIVILVWTWLAKTQ